MRFRVEYKYITFSTLIKQILGRRLEEERLRTELLLIQNFDKPLIAHSCLMFKELGDAQETIGLKVKWRLMRDINRRLIEQGAEPKTASQITSSFNSVSIYTATHICI